MNLKKLARVQLAFFILSCCVGIGAFSVLMIAGDTRVAFPVLGIWAIASFAWWTLYGITKDQL